jgi:hypothetical protein
VKDLTLATCSYNTPQHTITMLKSFVSLHNDYPYNLLIMENSTNDDTQKLLIENGITWYGNPGGTHSPSVDVLIDKCTTKYMLLVDTDIIFLKPIDILLQTIKNYDAAMIGEVQGSRGGYLIKNRVAPWFCIIDIEKIKANNIKFHSQDRIDSTGSNDFYKNIPLHLTYDKHYLYDVGCTFYEDILKAKLKIINAKGIQSYIVHAEGSSWQINCGHEGLMRHGKLVREMYQKEIERYKNIDIKGKFI